MATTGIIVYYLFVVLGLIPDLEIAETGDGVTIFGFEPITILNVVFLGIAIGFIGLLLTGRKGAPGDRVVKDPVTGSEVTVKKAEYCTVYDESIYYFESEDSRAEFRDSPETYLSASSMSVT